MVDYETMDMIEINKDSHKYIPCGFNKSGQFRLINKESHVGRLRSGHQAANSNPKMIVCITMYNEDEEELKFTMRGVLQNFEAMVQDPDIRMKRDDLIVVLICDGAAQIPKSFI